MTFFVPPDQLDTMLELEASQTMVNPGRYPVEHMARMMALSVLKRNSDDPLYIEDMNDCF